MDLIDYFFPPHCISCDKHGEYLCKTCKKKLLPHPEICPLCHRFSAHYETCLNCKPDKNRHLEGIIIPFAYSSEIKKLILKLKYYHKKDVVNFLIDRLVLAIQLNQKLSNIFPLLDKVKSDGIPQSGRGGQGVGLKPELTISYVPSHRYRRLFIKGYNQSELLARKLAEKLGLPCMQIVKKSKYTKSQAGLKRKDRLKNLKNAFSLTQNNLTDTEMILLVDDVTTTGSTLNQIAKVIKKSYPRIKVRGLVIARHIG